MIDKIKNPVVAELEAKMLGCTMPSWAKRAKAEIERLEQQRDELLAAQQWQPIETAPKDGTAILALIEGSDIPQSVRYRNGGWKVCWDDYRIAGIDGPTHWMPLPADPAIASVKGGV